jgi:hypothetical protein
MILRAYQGVGVGKELTKIKRRREAKEQFARLDDRRDQAIIIHYSCESFYHIKDGRTPRVTSIALRNFATGQTESFSIHKSAEQSGVDVAKIFEQYDALERSMLDEYFNHLKTLNVHTFVHWNMRDINFGFQAIEHRFKVLGGTPEVIDDSRKVDLARLMVAMFGVSYAPHGDHGRMHSLMTLNSITARDALPGEEEAAAFDNREYIKLHQSTLRKVDVMGNLLERALDGSLKTKSSLLQRYGIHPAALLELLFEHWVWTLFVVGAAILGFLLDVRDLF